MRRLCPPKVTSLVRLSAASLVTDRYVSLLLQTLRKPPGSLVTYRCIQRYVPLSAREGAAPDLPKALKGRDFRRLVGTISNDK